MVKDFTAILETGVNIQGCGWGWKFGKLSKLIKISLFSIKKPPVISKNKVGVTNPAVP